MKKLFVLAVIVVFGAGVIMALWHKSPKYEEIELAPQGIGSSVVAPDFRLPKISGGYVSLSEVLQSRPVLLYFWATWCPMCSRLRPDVEALRKKIDGEKLAIFAVNIGVNDPIERVVRYVKENRVSLPVLYDRKGEVSARYGAFGVPLFVLINSDGKIIYWGHELPDVLGFFKSRS
ncbi:peroxiredoxin family protein [Thermodesulforhabdus norvegica]|uniref:Peroxiredoxin n=1 Tax=Thermodesulforhabdus norvegica TaxID=39841 RepID=A0A1I4RIC6_9BACT|nr:TlpA disulfide reductase family protein [Thermodesulforhabdus norvegica]SFM51975.1 Peroxiredoxin [Thermodesulforhabdus norvegica]